VILGDVVVPEHDMVLDLNTEEGVAHKRGREANQLAYSKLLLCCDDDVSFCIVDAACTTELPRGCAKTAWDGLVAKFEPKTSASKVKLWRQFAECVLEDSSKHPEEWIAELDRIRQLLIGVNSPISDEDLIVHILNNLPKEYETVVEAMEREIDVLLLSELREELRNKYERIIKFKKGKQKRKRQH
jgi:hypothetical protein